MQLFFLLVTTCLFRLPAIATVVLTYHLLCRSEKNQLACAPIVCKIIVWLLPTNRIMALRFGHLIGDISYYLGINRHVILDNLAIIFGNTHAEIARTQLMRQAYRFAGALMVESFIIDRMNINEIRQLICFDESADCAGFLHDAQKHGCILLGVHNTNPYFTFIIDDLLRANNAPYCYALGHQQKPLAEAAKALLIGKTSLKEIPRGRSGLKVLLKAIKAKHTISLIADVDYTKSTYFYPLFGEQASVASGVYYFAQKSRHPVYFCACHQAPDLSYKVHLQKINYDITADNAVVQERVTSQYFVCIEQLVKKYPEQYQGLFMRRFRTRPAGDERRFYKKQ